MLELKTYTIKAEGFWLIIEAQTHLSMVTLLLQVILAQPPHLEATLVL